MRFVRSLQVFLLAIAMTLVGCSGGSSPMPGAQTATMPTTTAPATIQVGDAPVDGIVAFELTVTSVVLHGSAGDVSVLSSPTEIELIHNAGAFEPLSIAHIPAGTYTGATITVSHPEVEIIDSTGHPVELAATLASPTAQVTFNPSITVGTAPLVINFDFNVAASVVVSGNTATITPTFTAAPAAVPANETEEGENDGEVEATGHVTNVSGNSFTISTEQSSQSLTFMTDSSTQFESPLASVSSLMTGMVVEVEAVTQTDGTLLARQVSAEEEANGLEVEGQVTSTTGSPVTQFVMVVQDEESSSSNIPALGSNLTVNLTGNTVFRIHDHHVDLSNLPFTPTFDASTLSVAQRVGADTTTPDPAAITADRVKLLEQSLTGTVSNYTSNGSQATFTLTVAPDSAFALLTGTTSLTVFQQPGTELDGISSVTNGAAVRVRGLLFNNSGFKLVATKIRKP